MKLEKNYRKNENSRFFLPLWFAKGVESSFQQRMHTPFSSEGLQLGLPFYEQREWKLFASILCRFQQDLATNTTKVLTLNSKNLRWDLSFSHRYYEQSLLKLLRQIGGLKLYLPGVDSYIGKSLFEEEYWELNDTQWVLSLKPHFDTYELLFGTVCAYSELVRASLGEPSLTSVLGRSKFLACSKALWLDLSGLDWLLFMRLETSKQWSSDRSLFCNSKNQYSENITDLFSGVYLGKNKKATLKQFYYILKKLCIKLYEHGLLDNSHHDGLVHNVKQIANSSHLLYSCRNDDWSESHLEHKKQSCKLFIKRLFISPNRCFFQMMGLGLTQELILQIKQEVCILLQSSKGAELKTLFIETKEGFLIPLVFLAIEWHFRMQRYHLLGFSDQIKNSEFNQKIMRPGSLSYKERLNHLVDDIKEKSFLKFVLECPFVTLASRNTSLLGKNSAYEKYRTDLISYLNGNEVQVESTANSKKKNDSSTVGSMKDYKNAMNVQSTNFDSKGKETLKKKCESKLEYLRIHTKKDYLKVQDSYIRSLEPKEREFVLAFKEKVHSDIFELHLHQRLVTYMSKGDYDMQKLETPNLQ